MKAKKNIYIYGSNIFIVLSMILLTLLLGGLYSHWPLLQNILFLYVYIWWWILWIIPSFIALVDNSIYYIVFIVFIYNLIILRFIGKSWYKKVIIYSILNAIMWMAIFFYFWINV